jgi:hypothetical protein
MFDQILAVGILGGAANEILHWWGLRTSSELPTYARSIFYWAITLTMAVLGGLVARLQLGGGGEPMIAFEVGLLTPLLLKKLVTAAGENEGRMGASSQANLMRFLRG